MPPLARRAVLLLPFAANACMADDPVPTSFAPLDFGYLTKLRLGVASLDIGAAPPPSPGDLGALSPAPPGEALRQMAEQRLEAAGGSGRAVFAIDRAAIVPGPGAILGNFAVHLEILDDTGQRAAFAEARATGSATGSATLGRQRPDVLRAALYQLTRQMMADMNVELEYQVRRSLRSLLQTTSAAAPEPAAVEKQDLASP